MVVEGEMGNPASDRAKMEVARSALKKLHTRQAHYRRELFAGNSKESLNVTWQYRLLRRMTEYGLIQQITNGSNPNTTRYIVQDDADLSRFLDNDRELTKLLWPNSYAEQLPLFEGENESDLAGAGLYVVPGGADMPEPAPEEAEPEAADIASANLKLLYGAVQNMIYIREKIEKLETTVESIREQCQAQQALIDSLLKEWRGK